MEGAGKEVQLDRHAVGDVSAREVEGLVAEHVEITDRNEGGLK